MGEKRDTRRRRKEGWGARALWRRSASDIGRCAWVRLGAGEESAVGDDVLQQARRAGQGQKADLGRRPRARPSAAGCGGEAGGGARRGAQTAHARSTDCARPRRPELDEDAAGSDGPKLCPTHTLVIGESGCPEGTSLPASVGAREGWGGTLEWRSANQAASGTRAEMPRRTRGCRRGLLQRTGHSQALAWTLLKVSPASPASSASLARPSLARRRLGGLSAGMESRTACGEESAEECVRI